MPRLITYATDMTRGLERFLASALAYGWTHGGHAPEILGLGGRYPGHVGRLQQMLPMLLALAPDELVLFCDGYDSVLCGTPLEAEAAYEAAVGSGAGAGSQGGWGRSGPAEPDGLSSAAPAARRPDPALRIPLFGAEVECFPHRLRAGEWPEVDAPYRFLNAGTWLSPAAHMAALWQRLRVWKLPPDLNDQAVLGDLYLQCVRAGQPRPFALDHRAQLVQNLWAACDHIEGGRPPGFCGHRARPRNRLTGTLPVVLHASGGAKMPGWAEEV